MRRCTLIFLLVALALGMSPAAAQDDDPAGRQVWVFYLSFWAGPNTWDWMDAMLDDRPLLGPYNSKLPEVAAFQINQARAAGIDAFIVNWFGLDENVTTTPALNNLLDRAAEQDFRIAAAVDSYPAEFNRDRDRLAASLRWLIEDRAHHPAYLHYDGKPVIFFAFQQHAGFDARVWRALRDEVDPERTTLWLAEGLSACCLYDGAMDGMYAFNMAWANGIPDHYVAERNIVYARGGTVYIPTVSPGWDEDRIARATNRPRPTSPRDRGDGQFLINAWQGALAAQSDVILVVSWNEFVENSHIEPSELYGQQSLDVLRDLAAAWRGTPPPALRDLPAGYAARADEPVPVYAAPDRSAAVVGYLESGMMYAVIDEDNGLYGLDFNGQTGFVPAELIRIMPAAP